MSGKKRKCTSELPVELAVSQRKRERGRKRHVVRIRKKSGGTYKTSKRDDETIEKERERVRKREEKSRGALMCAPR